MRWKQVTSKMPKMLSSMEMEKGSAQSIEVDASTTPKEDPLFSREVGSSSYIFAFFLPFFSFFYLLVKLILVSCTVNWDIGFLLTNFGAERDPFFMLVLWYLLSTSLLLILTLYSIATCHQAVARLCRTIIEQNLMKNLENTNCTFLFHFWGLGCVLWFQLIWNNTQTKFGYFPEDESLTHLSSDSQIYKCFLWVLWLCSCYRKI